MTGEALTEEEALKLYRGWGNLRPEQLPRAKERLRGYMQARQLAGEPLWPQMEANWNRAQMEREESLWLNEDTDLSVRQIDFMAGVTGRSPFDIASEPNRYRQAVAAYLGSAKDGETPEAFDALVKSHVTRRRDARLLKWGNGKDDEASEAENQLSMARFAGEAARIGKDSIQAFQEWQRAVSGKPGYAALQSEGEGLYTEFQQRHAEASDYWRDLERRADAIIGELSAETENDSPFVIGNTALPHLDGLTRPQRQMVMALVTERAKGKDKGFAKQSVEALGRVFSRLTEATGDSLSRQALDALAFKEGDEVAKSLAGNPKKLVTRRASASVAAAGAGMLGDTSGMAGVDPEELFGDTVNLTKEQAAAANAEVSRRRESLAVVGDLRDAARGAVDPVRGSNFVTKWAWYPFLNVTGSLASFIMPGGWAANVGAYVNEEQNRLESLGVDRSTAAAQAVTVGSAQALMDKLQLKFLGRMTALRGVTSKLAAPAASTAGFFGRRVPAAVGTAAVQTGIEAGQEALPLAVQKTLDALGVDEPDVSWSDIGSEAWAATEESFFGMLPLMLLGAGVGARRDFKSMQSLVSDRGALQAMGFDEAATERIAGAGNEDAMVAALQREWPGRTPIYTAPASPGEAQADAVLQNEAAPVSARTGAAQFKAEIEEARAFSARMNSVLMEEAGIRAVRRSDAGWTVHGEDGSSVTLESPGEVSAALLQMAHARDRESAQEIIAEVDALTAANVKRGEGTEVSFTGETRKATLEGDTLTATKVKQGKPSPLDVSPESLATLHGEMKALGLTDAVIRGSNWLKEDAGKIVRHYELNLGSDVSTVVHERVESLFKSGVAAPAEVWAAANQLAALPQFDPAKLKDDGQRRMAESLRRIALEDDSVTEDERRETLVELAVADYLGRWKDGTTFAPGSLRDAVRRAEAGAKGATRRALEAFSRWLAMVGRYFGALFGTVKAIREARASGELKPGEAWDTMMNKLLGLDVQAEHEAAVLNEAGIDIEQSFSLNSGMSNAPGAAQQQDSTPPGGREQESSGLPRSVPNGQGEQGTTPAPVNEQSPAPADGAESRAVVSGQKGSPGELSPAGALDEALVLGLHPQANMFQSAPVSGRLPDFSGGSLLDESQLSSRTFSLSRARDGVSEAVSEVRRVEAEESDARRQWGLEHGRSYEAASFAGERIPLRVGWSEQSGRWAANIAGGVFRNQEIVYNRYWSAYDVDRVLMDGHEISRRPGADHMDFAPFPESSELAKARARLVEAEVDLFLAEEEDGGREQRMADKESAGQWARRTKAAQFAALLEARDAEHEKQARGFVSSVWTAFARNDEIFQFGRTRSKNAARIAEAVSAPGRPVSATDTGQSIVFSGKEGALAIYDADTSRPYIRSTGANSQGKKEGGGSQLYAAALDWIHNNKKRIKDDSGLTDINAVRRTSNFLASALRWGTTRHLKPHAKQGVPWTNEETLNLSALAAKEMQNAFSAIAEARGWSYDFQSGKFRDNAGNDITRDGFESAVRLGNPSKSGIGLSTLQRAVITHSAIRAFERGETANDVLETEIGGVVPPGVTYSLGSVGVLEQIAAAQEARAAARGPKAKLEMHADMARTLSGMARAARMNEETERVLALGEIETERRALQQRLKDEYTLEVYRGPVGAALGEEENAEIKSHPFLAKIIEPGPHGLVQGRFLSPEKAKKAGMDLEGEYDGAREWGLPGWLFKGVMEPDLMAKELGIERVDDMWSEIASSLESLNKAKKRLRKAQEQLAEAKIRAREDARTWAGMERAKLAESDKRDAKRALVALDAMMLHAPAEVRVKVGGFARMNELTTNKAREAYFKDRLEALDREMEAYLRRQYLKETRELFHKSRARRVSGEKDKGRLGTNAHTWIETAEAISKLSAQKLSEREAWVNARLFPQKEEDRLTEDEIKELNRAWDLGTGEDAALLALEQEQAILELFGRLDKKDSAELESALTALRETADRGRAQWDATLRDRRERRAGRRAGLKIDSGNEGSAAERAEKAKELRGMKGRKDAFFNLGASMEQLIGDFFGRESDTHMWAEETILNARLTAEAAFIDSQRRMSELLKRLWPRSKGWQRAKHLEKLATEKPVAGAPDGTPELSELQAIHMTMLWSDWESWQWLRDHGFGEETQEKLEAHLSPEAREIRAFLVEEYDRQYDRLNDVYRRLHGVNMPRVRNYAPRMVLHGGDTVTLDPLAGGSMSSRGVFAGFTKRRRPDLTAAPVLADALQAFMQNQKVVTHFLGWAEASGDLRAVFSTSETKPFIVAAAGDQGARSLHERLTDLEAGGFKEALAMGYWKGFMRALADNALVGKIGPFLKQASAVYGSAVELGWGPYLRSAGRLMRGEAAATVEQVAALPIMKTRLHNLSQETMQAASGTGPAWMTRQLRRAGFDTAFVDAGMIWMRNRLGVLDAVLTLRGAAIAYDSHWLDAKEQKMSDAAAHDYAARETQRTIARTAQPASVADRSHYENRAGTFGRLMFAFQSMNRQMFFATWAALRDGGIKDARARRMLGTWWVLTGIITQAIGAGVRDMFSDDDEDEDWKLGDFLRAATLGPLTGALYLGPLVDVASSWLGGFERRTEVSPAGAVSDFTKEAIEALKADEELEAKEVEKIARSAGLFGQAAGGGWWSSLNVLANLWKQGSGLADNLFTSEEEALEADAARQRKADKEARDAAADALTDEQKEAARKEREANRRKRLEREAERWRARQ